MKNLIIKMLTFFLVKLQGDKTIVSPEGSFEVQVDLSDPGVEHFADVLMMSKERHRELVEFVENSYKGNVAESMHECSLIAKHPNELAYMCYVIGATRVHKHHQASNPLYALRRMFGGE